MSGQFEIQDLDESLLFSVLIAANGFHSKIEGKVDPSLEPLESVLRKLNADLPAKQRMTGRVVDASDRPLFGASVYITGAAQAGRGVWTGRVDNVDKVAITDQDGKFVLTSTQPYSAWQLSVTAAGYYRQKTEHLHTGDQEHLIKMHTGCFVTGVVKQDGKPVPDHHLGIRQKLNGDNNVGATSILTDEQGRFQFTAAYPDDDYFIYSITADKPESGAIETVEFQTTGSETIKELGDFELQKTYTVKGRVVLTNSKPFPLISRMAVIRTYADDPRSILVDEDGSFEINSLPNEPVLISLRIPGYHVKSNQPRLQKTDDHQVAFYVDGDTDGLMLLFDADD